MTTATTKADLGFTPPTARQIADAPILAVSTRRVSTGPQADKGTSLDSQWDGNVEAAARLNALIIDDFADAGVSGALFRRPGIQQAIALVKRLKKQYSNKTVLLLMMRLDRSGREVRVCRAVRDAVRLAGGQTYFCDGFNFDSSAVGEFGFTVFSAAAQLVRDQTRENTMRGHRKKAEQGQQPYRVLHPYGYQIATHADVLRGTATEAEVGTYRVIEDDAEQVRQMFRDVVAGGSLRAVCARLNAQKVPTPRAGSEWRANTLRVIITNPVYKGTPTIGKTQSMVDEDRMDRGLSPYYSRPTDPSTHIKLTAPALVPESVWDAANAVLATNVQRKSGNPAHRYLLSGWMRCPVCGTRMSGRTTAANSDRNKQDVPLTRYTCAATMGCFKDDAGEPRCHHATRYPAEMFEWLFARCLSALVSRPEMMQAAVVAWERHERDSQRERIASRAGNPISRRVEEITAGLETLIGKQDAAITAQMRAIERGLDDSRYLATLDRLQGQEKALREEMQRLSTSASVTLPEPPVEIATQRIRNVGQWLRERGELVLTNLASPDLTVMDKRDIIDALVRSLETDLRLTPEGKDALRVDLTLGGSLVVSELYSEYPPPAGDARFPEPG